VITPIAGLDRPQGGYLPVSQQPLEDLRVSMDAGTAAPPRQAYLASDRTASFASARRARFSATSL
jgi:hypothetical protein